MKYKHNISVIKNRTINYIVEESFYVCKRYDANAGAKLLKNMDLQRFMGFIKRKNMKFNAILPLKWQNTANIMAILVGLKQETVSLMPRKSARRNCCTMIVSFRKGRGKKQRFLHYSIRNGARNAFFCVLTERSECGNNVSG